MKPMNTTEMKRATGGGKYIAYCNWDGCDAYFSASYTGAVGGLSWSTAKTLCEGQLRNHVIEVHYDNLRRL